MSLPEALERAAQALPDQADAIRPANGDPDQLLSTLDDAGSAAVLQWLLANEPDAGEELLAAWCEDERGIARVKQVDLAGLPKAGKKIVRRAHHRLRTRGVDVSRAKSAEPVVAKLSDVDDELEGAYMTPVDPRGSQLIFIVEANPGGGARLFQVQLDERRGLVEFDVYTTGRSRTRSFLRKLTDATPSGASGAVEVDASIARGVIARIAAAHPADRPFPRAFSEWRRKLETGAGDTAPGEAAREMLGDAADDAPLERVAARVEQTEVGPWPPGTQRLTEVSASLGAAVDAVIEMHGEARERALEAAVDEATRALFDGAHARHTAARFEASAYVSALSGREDEARDCLAAAVAFGEGDAAHNPIARKMTELFTASILKRAEIKDPEASDSGADES